MHLKPASMNLICKNRLCMDLHQHHVFVADQSFVRYDVGILIKFWKTYSLIYSMLRPGGFGGHICMTKQELPSGGVGFLAELVPRERKPGVL